MASEDLESAGRVINTVDAIMGYWDCDLRCRFANAAYETWFGISPREMLGIPMGRFLGASYQAELPYLLHVLNGEAQAFEREITLPSGAIRHGLVSYYPDVVEGVVRGFSVHIANITRVKRLEFELEKCQRRAELLATHDFLTGLPNRFLLMDRISALLSQGEMDGELVGIVAMDIDGFKSINETFGYDAGDGVMREISRRMKGAILPKETVVRMSGDDFLLLTGGTHPTEVNLAISRLLDAVQQPLQYASASITPSINYGAAVFPLNGTSASELLATADRALKQAMASKNKRPL
jgi:diguanylate cyclase (GGDEF)-like protein